MRDVGGELGTQRLVQHPAARDGLVTAVNVDIIDYVDDELSLMFTVWPASGLSVPTRSAPARMDDLWQTTCFEAFLRPDGAEHYFEFNLSPSSAWAAYAFDRHREGRHDLPLPSRFDPMIEGDVEEGNFYMNATLDVSGLEGRSARLGLAAVTVDVNGVKSYWAIRHAPGDEPDFHHQDCFALALPPATAT